MRRRPGQPDFFVVLVEDGVEVVVVGEVEVVVDEEGIVPPEEDGVVVVVVEVLGVVTPVSCCDLLEVGLAWC